MNFYSDEVLIFKVFSIYNYLVNANAKKSLFQKGKTPHDDRYKKHKAFFVKL